MPIFVIFVFGSIVLGAGAMLAPALPTHGPRIGLAAALSLAIVLVGAIGYATLFHWNTLVIDYLWFALLVGIFLTGTLSAGMFRSEAEGGTKEYSGWPGPRELAFFTLTALIFAAPALILPVPVGTEAQGFGYLGLTLKLGGTFTTLTPYHPEINWLYSPAFPALIAYLGTQLNAGLQNIQLAVGAVLSLIVVWTAYDFGNELSPGDSRRTGMAMAVTALFGVWLLGAFLPAHYTALLGVNFALAFLTFAMRFWREGKRADFLGAVVTLAALPLSQPDITILLGVGYALWLVTLWFGKPKTVLACWLLMALAMPLIALLLILPWFLQIRSLLSDTTHSPFNLLESAWYAALIPFMYLGGQGLLRLIDRAGRKRAETWIRTASLPLINLIALVIVLSMIFVAPLLAFTKTLPIKPTSAFASEDDVAAMQWLKQNAPADALILNYPGVEGDWVPAIAQRNSVYFASLPFYRGTEQAQAQQQALRVFWQNPSENIALLEKYGIDYVIVPQVITRPELIQSMFRWEPPYVLGAEVGIKNAPPLELVFEKDGAQVYRVLDR